MAVTRVLHMEHPAKYAEEIGRLLAESFGEAGERATAYIGTQWFLILDTEEYDEEDDTGNHKVVALAGAIVSGVEKGTIYLNRALVVPEYRGLGLQKKLIKARCNYGKKLGLVQATSDTWANAPSANNLIACGFRAYHPEKPWRAEGTMYWRKGLL